MMTPFRYYLAVCLVVLLASTAYAAVTVSKNLTITVTGSGPAPGFYVATTGSDTNPGTLAQPFLTLGKCQTAMRGSSTKTCYIRAGNYAPTQASSNCNFSGSCAVLMSSLDNNETWSYYPSDGYNTADITGGSTSSGTGLNSIFELGNSSGVTIDGLLLHHIRCCGIISISSTSNITIQNNIIHTMFTGNNNSPALIFLYDTNNTTISHNALHTSAGDGISIIRNVGTINNVNITGNVIYTVCTGFTDCGGIYIQDIPATSTGITVTNNFIRDVSSGTNGNSIYLDDCLSNVTATGNVITGHFGEAFLIHGGSGNHMNQNLIDLTGYASFIANFFTSDLSGCSSHTMSGNQLQHNIIVGKAGGGGYHLGGGSPVNPPSVTASAYWNYAGSAISSDNTYQDTNPTTENPQLSGCYSISGGSPVFNPPVSFSGLTGGWGPPGYVIPATSGSSTPSYPSPTC